MPGLLKKSAYAIDSHASVTWVLAVATLIIAVVPNLNVMYPDITTSYPKLSALLDDVWWLCFVICTVVYPVKLVMSFFFLPLNLSLNRTTRILRDTNTGFENVSLRRETINKMLGYINEKLGAEALKELGTRIGGDFQNKFLRYQRSSQEGFNYSSLELKKKVDTWLEYDSCTGMGRFTSGGWGEDPKRFDVIAENSFTTASPDQKSCEFLRGYIEGYCSPLLEGGAEVTECRCSGGAIDSCKFTVTQKSNR